MIWIVTKYRSVDEIKLDDMGGACGTQGGGEEYIQVLVG
jgi:hypothetical protein